jgi:hypothetical protein
MYTVDYFIDKFSKLSESQVVAGSIETPSGNKCANGWCGVDFNYTGTGETAALDKLLRLLPIHVKHSLIPIYELSEDSSGYSRIAEQINDGFIHEYQQETPKQRILASLYDIKRLQSKDTEQQQPKERIVYVSVPVSITVQVKDLITN